MEIVNVGLLKHPINWFTVVLMVMIASIAAHLILTHYTDGKTPPLSA